jgi:hypothetical protein
MFNTKPADRDTFERHAGRSLGMLLMSAATKAAGKYTAMVPNVCFVPAPPPVTQVPIPFPSFAEVPGTDGAVDKVMMENKEVVVEGSKVPNTSGDVAGTKGGLISGTYGKEAVPKLASSKVFAKGKKVVFLTATTTHNNSNPNAPGLFAVPSQMKVFVGL